ncbi:MAG: hypothetical protein ACKOD2_19535, partial [Ilumatobacteraceae bacterium]
VSAAPDVVILLAGSDGGSRFLGTLATRAPGTTVIVNDAFSSVDFSDDPTLDSLAGVDIVGVAVDTFVGTSTTSSQQSPVSSAPFSTTIPSDATGTKISGPPLATATVDCIDLLALAAQSAGSDDPGVFMPLVIPASKGGSACADFATCRDLLEAGLNVDYNGPSAVLSLDPNGDPLLAVFVTFGIGGGGLAEYRDTIGVVSAP